MSDPFNNANPAMNMGFVSTATQSSSSVKSEDSASPTYGPRRHKKPRSGTLTEEELRERRKKHNQVEIRRRKRIKASFNELGQICGCDSKQKRIILSSAIDMIKEYEDRIKNLQTSIDALDAAGADDDAKGSAPVDSTDIETMVENVIRLKDGSTIDHESIFHDSGVPLNIASFDGRILDCNLSFARLFGYTREQLLEGQNTTLFSLTSPESLSIAYRTVGALMNGRPSVQANLSMVGANQTPSKVKLTAWSIKENGKPKYFMSMVLQYADAKPGDAAAAPSSATVPSSSLSVPVPAVAAAQAAMQQ